MLKGWNSRYNEILKEFQYQKKKDAESASILNSLLKNKNLIKEIKKLIENQNVLIIGAGPSLSNSIPYLKNKKN